MPRGRVPVAQASDLAIQAALGEPAVVKLARALRVRADSQEEPRVLRARRLRLLVTLPRSAEVKLRREARPN